MRGYVAEIGSERLKIEIPADGSPPLIDGRLVEYSHVWIGDEGGNLHLVIDGRSYDFRIEDSAGVLIITHAGRRHHCTVIDEHIAELKQRAGLTDRPTGRTVVKAPMPGLVVRILVEPGDHVQKGDRILILEAMKMENDVKAPRAGRVSSISAVPGQPVEGGRELAVIE